MPNESYYQQNNLDPNNLPPVQQDRSALETAQGYGAAALGGITEGLAGAPAIPGDLFNMLIQGGAMIAERYGPEGAMEWINSNIPQMAGSEELRHAVLTQIPAIAGYYLPQMVGQDPVDLRQTFTNQPATEGEAMVQQGAQMLGEAIVPGGGIAKLLREGTKAGAKAVVKSAPKVAKSAYKADKPMEEAMKRINKVNMKYEKMIKENKKLLDRLNKNLE